MGFHMCLKLLHISVFSPLCVHMMGKMLAILTPFLAFAFVYNSIKSHNMLTMMLDMHFKSFDVVKALVERLKVVDMVTKYDYKTFMLLLMDVFIRSKNIVCKKFL